ncbi:superoxide dismutase [Kitasatospora sp. NPDC048286]|uniref:superoxide dismutase n=1 Tax=Kitasatospora sp. NPDC048286 TaxID=3364047 RepID=UPI00371E4196
MKRSALTLAAALVATPLLAACGSSATAPAASGTSASAAPATASAPSTMDMDMSSGHMAPGTAMHGAMTDGDTKTDLGAAHKTDAVFGDFAANPAAPTYDTTKVPAGAKATVQVVAAGGSTLVRMEVSGLLPSTVYGSHAHVNACGANGDAAGGHFEHTPDPKGASTDPQFANPTNEIWLDFQTDAQGHAVVWSKQPWDFSDGRAPKSVILHAMKTETAAGSAGKAGSRLACANAAF